MLLEGLQITIVATFVGMAIALVLGLFVALALRIQNRPLFWVIDTVREFIQNTPPLVQLFFAFFILPQYTPIRLSALATGIVVLGIHFSTYVAEVYRAGIDAVDSGQWEAAYALHLTRLDTYKLVILPQALPPIIPVLGNYLISMFKTTPQLLAIGVLELMGTAQLIGGERFRYFELFTVVAFVYLALSYPSSLWVRRLERRYGQLA